MSSVEKIRKQYIADIAAVSYKPRFGYFSIPPSHTAGKLQPDLTKNYRDENGKVKTQPRNLYPGVAKRLSKTAFMPCPYDFKPQAKSTSKDEVFRPALLRKTLMSASYPHLAERPQHNLKRGKIVFANRNIFSSTQVNIHRQMDKQFKYVACPYDQYRANAKEDHEKDMKTRREEPFKNAPHPKEYFSTVVKLYCDKDIVKKERKENQKKIICHDQPFRPSCTATNKFFNPVEYKEEGGNKNKYVEPKIQEPFRLVKVQQQSKPCPSISCLKINLLR